MITFHRNQLSGAKRIHLLVACMMAAAAAVTPPDASASTGDAAFVAGKYEILPAASGSTASVQVAGIQNTTVNTTTGSLGFELWYSSEPYSGGTIDGYKVAASYLPIGNCSSSQLVPGQSCLDIIVTDALIMPPAGTYYPVLLLVEHTSGCTSNNGFCIDDFVALTNSATGGPTVTVTPVSDGGSGVTGNAEMLTPVTVGSIDWTSDTVDISVSQVLNVSGATSGSLAVQLWFTAAPYASGSSISGYKVASFPVPASCTTGDSQLGAGMGCTSIDSGTIDVTPPPAGTYYAVLVLAEYNPSACSTNAGYCVDNAVNLENQETVPSQTTVVTSGGGTGGGGTSGGGGGGSMGGWWIACLVCIALVRLRRLPACAR